MIIVEHLEHYLGEIESGIKCLDRRYHLSVSVFPSQPYKGVTTFSTLGLNRYDLNYKSRFELIFTCSEEWNKENIAAFLSGVAEYLIDNRQPILRGEIIQLPRVIIEGSKMDALYVSTPFYFDDDFQVCYGEHYNIVFPLLVPLYKQEAELVEKKGWNAFEQFLLDNEVGNLSDMNRKPFVW